MTRPLSLNEYNMGMDNHHATHYELIELCTNILISQKEILYRAPEEVKEKSDQIYLENIFRLCQIRQGR